MPTGRDHYETLVADTLKKLTLSEEPTVCFHYSARFSREDREAVLRGARRIRPKGKYVFVWINTHHQIQLYDARAETDGSIARGRYMIGGRNQIYLSTTGFNPYRKTLGTPHVLEVNVHVEPAPGAPPDSSRSARVGQSGSKSDKAELGFDELALRRADHHEIRRRHRLSDSGLSATERGRFPPSSGARTHALVHLRQWRRSSGDHRAGG